MLAGCGALPGMGEFPDCGELADALFAAAVADLRILGLGGVIGLKRIGFFGETSRVSRAMDDFPKSGQVILGKRPSSKR